MAFFTRPELTNEQFKQLTTSVLTLSGETNFVGILKSKGVEIDASSGGTFAGYVLTLDPTGIIKLKPSSSGGTGVYTAASPSTITVGGIPSNTTLTGRTFESLWEQLLVVYQQPTFTLFNNNIGTLNEVGNPSSWSGNKLFSWNTSNSGNITPNSIEIKDVTENTILGTGLANDTNEQLQLLTTINNVVPIAHTWNIGGTNTENNPMNLKTYTIESIYPWYWGIYDAGSVPAGVNRPDASNPVVAQQLIDSGNKVVAKSNGTLTVQNFNATPNHYTWIAVPQSTPLKSKWVVNTVDFGNIGDGAVPENKYLSPNSNPVTEVGGFWNGIFYNFYVSSKQAATGFMQFKT